MKTFWKAVKCTFFHRGHHFSWDGGHWGVFGIAFLRGRCECTKCNRKWNNG